MKRNIVLIGMPASGKSTVGVVLAKSLGMNFMDTDLVIQQKTGRKLQEIINEKGLDYFVELEADILSEIQAENTVISTGGSAIYRERAMDNLKKNGAVVYLKVPLETIKQRLGNIHTRGIAMKPGESIASLYNERVVLYEKYAEFTIDGEGKTVEEVVDAICPSREDENPYIMRPCDSL